MIQPVLAPGIQDLPLSDLPVGTVGCVVTEGLDQEDRVLLAALGLRAGCQLRICKRGTPCIVQIRHTRLGLTSPIARRLRLRVAPDALAG